ncbi:MAG TPA: lipopolysaccharide biosynthesis protein [Sandaracinaceae bacterium LLY-WYZ-13_1]|nr:lipopolysaccharide biosynthesis protein [Sandaracinaceae bacterium LLY-WYZ-13_1]
MSEERAKDETRHAGRGLLWVAGGKIVFILTAYSVALALPRLFGSEQVFGFFSAAFGAASILNNVLIASTVQTVSKLVSEDEDRAAVTLRQGLRLQLVVGLTLGGGLALAAPLVAERVLLDAELTPLIRVAGGVVFAYATYAALVGYLNGRRRFSHQARLDMTFSVLRTTGLLGGAALGIGALGAMGGFGLAAATILGVALVVVGVGRSASDGRGVPLKRWLAFMAPIWLYQAALNGMLQIDLQVLKRTATALALDQGMTQDPATDLADVLVGYYRAAQTFAFVPYQLILSVTFIVFPFVSRATSLGDDEAAQRYIRNAMRFSLLVLLSIATPIAGAASGVLRIAYPEAYLAGADALGVLVFGMVAFALFVIGATILTGAGRPLLAATIALLSLVVVVVATWLAIGWAGIEGHDALVATATGTSLGTTLAVVLVGLAVYRGFGAFVPPLSALRGVVAGAAAFATARAVPHDTRLLAIAALASGFAVYLGVLVATRELSGQELRAVGAILRRRSDDE